MICKIADLIVSVPEAEGLSLRCQEYRFDDPVEPDIVIRPEWYNKEKYGGQLNDEQIAYLESGLQFASKLIRNHGFYLHSSAVEVDGKAYLFSGPCGVGKSTHVELWQQLLGDRVCRFNDDKPALRRLDDGWYAYGTPWCGKDGINANRKVPLAAICFLKQGQENRIRRLDPGDAVPKLLSQTIRRFRNPKKLDFMLSLLEKLVWEIPIYELENRPVLQAAELSYKTLCTDPKETGL